MSEDVFKQSLSWALAMNEEERLEQKRQDMSDSTSSEVVEFDYTFLEMEDD